MTTSLMTSRYTFAFVVAICTGAMLASAGLVGASQGQSNTIGLAGVAIDVAAITARVEITNLPDLTVQQPF